MASYEEKESDIGYIFRVSGPRKFFEFLREFLSHKTPSFKVLILIYL